MANYGFIRVSTGPKGASREKRIQTFALVLSVNVKKVLGDRWVVSLATWEDEGPVWIVHLPGTGVPDNGVWGCTADGRPFNQDIGFVVALQRGAIAFRHSFGTFERWAQGCVEEQLSEHYGKGIFYDATDTTTKPGPKNYRAYKTYYEYVTRNFDKPLSEADKQYLERYKQLTPEGFWDGDW